MGDGESGHALYIITGTSGTGIEPSIEKFTGAHGGRLVRLEHCLRERASEVFGHQLTMIELFSQPEGILRDLWVDACVAAGEQVRMGLETGDVFLRMNATWYHVSSGGFVSGLHVPTLRTLPKPRLVLTLIDDVYDILTRLRRPEKLFEHLDRGETIASVVMKLLSWREVEIRQAQQLALSFDSVGYYLFAVKHPTETFRRLLTAPSDAVTYLSHPISVPRREPHGSAGQIAEYLEETARVLRARDDTVLLEPTTIDEWRMDRHALTGDVQSLDLKERWALPGALSGEPPPLLHDELLDEAERGFAAQPFARSKEDLAALKLLSSEIKKQVSWRDRMMVEQSARALVVRPFASEQGKISGGVLEEYVLHWELEDYFTSSRVAQVHPDRGARAVATLARSLPVVYHPPEDEKSRRVGAIVEVIVSYGSNGRIAQWPTTTDDIFELRSELVRQLRALDVGAWLAEPPIEVGAKIDATLALCRTPAPYLVGPTSGSTLAVGAHIGQRDRTRREIGSDVKQAMEAGTSLSQGFSLSTFARAHLITDSLSGAELAERAAELIAIDRNEKAPD